MTLSKIGARIPVILACLAVALPALASPALFYPAAWSQATVFRLIVSLFLAFSVFVIAQRHEVLEKLRGATNVLIPLGAFICALLVALVFSRDAYMSFWNLPLRGWGLFNSFSLMLFALLAFLFLRKEDWKWVWTSALGTGAFVTLVAIAQQRGLLHGLLTEYPTRPPGTLGNPIFLGIYLLLLCLLTLSFAVAKHGKLRTALFGLAIFFAIGILLTLSRGAFLGLGAGLLFFLAFSPRRPHLFKVTILLLLLFGIGSFTLINVLPSPQFANENLNLLWQRLQIKSVLDLSRILGWQMQLRGVAQSPIVGYGPYNIHIPFNKEYTPSFARLTGSSGYWDTSHNELLDVLVGSGMLGLGTYLVFLGSLWLHLENIKRKQSEYAMLAHGLQATLVGYHAAIFFFPNTFATSLIFYAILAFSLHIASPQKSGGAISKMRERGFSARIPLAILGGILLVAFNWYLVFQPLLLNRQITIATNIKDMGSCKSALIKAEGPTKQDTFLNYYANLKYVDLVSQCIESLPAQTLDLSKKAVSALEQEIRVRPTEPRTWILLGGYTNNLAALEKDPIKKAGYVAQADRALEQALALSPNRPEVFPEWATTKLIAKDYEAAKQKIEQCLTLNADNRFCLFEQAHISIELGDVSRGLQELAYFKSVGGVYEKQGEGRILRLLQSLLKIKERPYAELVELYAALIQMQPEKPQYYASIAAMYRELGQYRDARDAAKSVLKIQPENKAAVEAFLQTLPPQYR